MRFGAAAAASLLVLACGALWYPLRLAAPFMDDHVFLMLGRHVDSPWPLLAQDSIGSYFFRPVVMGLWWVTERAFAGNAALHYAFNLAVHGLNAGLLLVLLRRHGLSDGVSLGAAAVFAAHPAAFSAAAWLCIRFDLLAATFGLAALVAAREFRRQGGWRWGTAAILATAGAIGSKETGFGIALLVAAILAAPPSAASRALRMAAVGAVTAVVAAALVLRQVLLRDVPELREPTHELLVRGVLRFFTHLPEFLVVRQGNDASVFAWIVLLAAIAAGLLFARARQAIVRRERLECAALGLALAALGIVAPAPIIAQIPVPGYVPDVFHIQPLLSARFFYLPLLGLVTAGAVLADAVRSAHPRAGVVGAVLAAVAVVGLAASSRSIGRDYAEYTRRTSGIYGSAATEAILQRTDLAPGCKIYFLGTPPTPAPAFHFREYADALVKNALPRGHPAVSCFIQSEHAPWHHFLPAGVGNVEPLQVIRVGGGPFAPLPVGNLVVHYLKVPNEPRVAQDPSAVFFTWRGGRFVDVTTDVRARRVVPAFFDNRPRQ